ncbi:MAG: LysR family transcriptional regulator [Proteobacteria bacterium]|nr:MAG: LysR family transcriptional regulator [Pseudomonadota bacterium]
MHTQMSDIRLLKIFLVVADSGSFAGAQPALNISLSTISSHIGTLETRLGFKLCTRGRSGFRLTDRGRQVYLYAQRLLHEVERFDVNVDNLKRSLSGEIRIGLIDNTISDTRSPLRRALQKFTKRKGNVAMRISICSPTELQQHVYNKTLHIGIGSFPTKIEGLIYTMLYDEEHRLYCGRTHPLFTKPSARLTDIKNTKIVARGYLHSQDLQLLDVPNAAATVENVEAQAYLILSGGYVGFLPAHYAEQWVNEGELRQLLPDDAVYESRFELVVKSGIVPNNPVDAFISDVQSTVADSMLNQAALRAS